MKKKERKFVYISNLDYSGTVFQTQILDWLYQFQGKGLDFDLIQAFHIKSISNPGFLRKQLKGLKSNSHFYAGSVYLLPSKSFFHIINSLIIYTKLLKYLFSYNEILIFSRAIIGKEISLLRKISPVSIIFYFDGRAAAAEENKYLAVLQNDFSQKRYNIIANTYYLVYQTLLSADKVFVVSQVLRKYFQDTYNLHNKKFIPYPCLSNSRKFFYSPDIRTEMRSSLGLKSESKVFIYSGGIGGEWHITEQMFAFLNRLFQFERNLILICLTKTPASFEKIISRYPLIRSCFFTFSVPNNEVHRYLNAADYGILFRENTIMNNVASPTKFAEYILCGLPVLISEGVGDYSDYAVKNDLGILVKEIELKDPGRFDLTSFFKKNFSREYIADIGKNNFSKESAIDRIVAEFIP